MSFHSRYSTTSQSPENIDYDDIEITYRNHSLLYPSNGGRLVSAPEGLAGQDVHTLTDGWRHGPGRSWESAAPPRGAALELVYAFDSEVTIQTVQLHNHPDSPSERVTLHTSDDGVSWVELEPDVAEYILPEAPLDPLDPTGMQKMRNFAFVLIRDLRPRCSARRPSEHLWGRG